MTQKSLKDTKTEHTPYTPRMNEQEANPSAVRFHKSSGLQNQLRPEETQEPREAGHRVPWQLIVIVLGILYSLRLVILTVLVTNIFQYSQEKYKLHEILTNLHHNYDVTQNDMDLMEKLLRNKQINCSAVLDVLDINREQEKWYRETKTVLNSSQHTGSKVEIHWFCYGIKCYYFIKDRKTWLGCKQTCQNYRLSLLKIDDEDEWKFLQLQVIPDNYWIGLKYDHTKREWSWIDNVPSKFALNTRKYNVKDGGCFFLSKTKLDNIDCLKLYSCICGKRLDKFPD
ncbi:killer cell lectin-like receptor 4 isoform X2 [Grammomys surdaster]|uniref:killer cell lectin-like receptor 4 isoform X2 n=1 Tax=Grammomys surdaster TaxID=491861 RepID=UPI00109F355F|nr:killer cell lectin-like receptor 4 isoform X2 [Grammomys surdaster]